MTSTRPRPEAVNGCGEELLRDGRHRRRQNTRNQILDACRALMLEGELTPDARMIALRARASSRTIYACFSGLTDLYRHALSDEKVAATLATRMPSEPRAVLRAVLLGEFARSMAPTAGGTTQSRHERPANRKRAGSRPG